MQTARRNETPMEVWADDIKAMEDVAAFLASLAGAKPAAWVMPGDDNASEHGYIDAMAWQEGEFTRPLYATVALATQATS